MATVHIRADTPVPPERIRAALTDFHRPPPGLLAQPRPELLPGARHRRHLG